MIYWVNPPVSEDDRYYREDDKILERVLGGMPFLAVGLRRSGKTSFLLRIQRAAWNAGLEAQLVDLLYDVVASDDADKALNDVLNNIKASPNTIVLLDEAEALLLLPEGGLERLLSACRGHTVVLVCAPIGLELFEGLPEIQNFIETFSRHHIGPLTDEEALDLLSQAKRRGSPLGKEDIEEILAGGERLPLILQALGAEKAEGRSISISLAGLGNRVLNGLTEDGKTIVKAASRGDVISSSQPQEAGLLVTLGALRQEGDDLVIASKTLAGFICRIGEDELTEKGEVAPTRADDGEWRSEAKILHLSDLHFGESNIEPGHPVDLQLQRLIDLLEKESEIPDFVAVTGDLTWKGHSDELEESKEFLEGLAAWLKKQRGWSDKQCRRRFIIVPGNHEACWNLSDWIHDSDLSPEDAEHWNIYSFSPFANFMNRFFLGTQIWDPDHPYTLTGFNEPSVYFFALSTCRFISERHGRGKFGSRVRKAVVDRLKKNEARQARFRIGLWHHNLCPRGGNSIVDGELALLDFQKVRPGIDMALCGHTHASRVDAYSPGLSISPFPFSAVGSFGVDAKHRPGVDRIGSVPNEFAIVTLETVESGRRFTTQSYRLEHVSDDLYRWEKHQLKSSGVL